VHGRLVWSRPSDNVFIKIVIFWLDCLTSYVMPGTSHLSTCCCLESSGCSRLSWLMEKLILRPSVAGTSTLKQYSSIFIQKIEKFSAEVAQPRPQTPDPAAGETPSRTYPSRRLPRLPSRLGCSTLPRFQNPKYASIAIRYILSSILKTLGLYG